MTSRELYLQSNILLGRKKHKVLPKIIKKEDLPDTFSTFFHNKIKEIRDNIDTLSDDYINPFYADKLYELSTFSNFRTVTESEVRKVIFESKSKTCTLDPIPTYLIKSCIEELLPTLTTIINKSLSSATFPKNYKHALISPLLKKPSLDHNILKNYRPVSNLTFLSKITEKIVLLQLKEYLDINNLMPPNQSAYRECHSTETALLRILNDLLLDIDNNKVSILSLLDLSAAFDTIDHSILLKRLEVSYGIKGNALSWFRTYLSNRSQSIYINQELVSLPSFVEWGVPQGSVLGPILFSLYIMPLNNITDQHAVSCKSFADDTQLYDSSSPEEIQMSIIKIQNCFSHVKAWMSTNKLKLNDEKTELLFIHSKHKDLPDNVPSYVTIGNSEISFSPNAKNLGVTVSDTLSLEKHINNVCCSAFAELRRIANIRRYLTYEATKTLVTALVISKIDYCNSLYYNIPNTLLLKLKKVQNSAARIIFQLKKRDHISPLLQKLHWLPINSRIQFKIATLCFKSFTDPRFPKYLSELLTTYKPTRNLRSLKDDRIISKCNPHLKKYGQRSFTYAASDIWNALPYSIRHSKNLNIFKSHLKTYLFQKAYQS